MLKALCPGSFDPITNGHLDVITRTAALFDEVLVTVFHNENKSPLFTAEERVEMAAEACAHLSNVQVDASAGLLADYVKENDISVIVKGLRAVSDFEAEFQMAQMNKELVGSAETMFLVTRTEHLFLSSSIIKEIARLGGDVTRFVPPGVFPRLKAKFS